MTRNAISLIVLAMFIAGVFAANTAEIPMNADSNDKPMYLLAGKGNLLP